MKPLSARYRRATACAFAALGAVLFAMFLVFGMPAAAFADDGGVSKYHQLTGAVYFSRSDDAKFCVSDGDEAGVVMAHVPIDLAEVCKVDLDEYGLGFYNMPAADPDAGYEYECTLLQLFVYAAERYYANGVEDMVVTGSRGSAFLEQYWGGDQNLLYYVNGRFPLESPGRGATCDTITISDGDIVTMAHYDSWSFWSDPATCFHFFADEGGELAHTYHAVAGRPLAGKLVKSWGNIDAGTESAISPEGGWQVWWGSRYDFSLDNAAAAGSATTDGDGKFAVTFDEPGEYWLWADGGVGEDGETIVSSPAAVRVLVEAAPAPEPVTDIAGAQVTAASQVYCGQELTPEPRVVLAGAVLRRGVDYTVSYSRNVNAGQGLIVVTGMGSYVGEASGTFAIAKAANGLKVEPRAKTLVVKKGKKATFKPAKVFKVTGNASTGAITYKLVKVPKKARKFVKLSANGKLTVKRGLPRGKYTLKVKITQAETANYQGKAIKSMSLKLRVK